MMHSGFPAVSGGQWNDQEDHTGEAGVITPVKTIFASQKMLHSLQHTHTLSVLLATSTAAWLAHHNT